MTSSYDALEARLIAAGHLTAGLRPLTFTLESDAQVYASHGTVPSVLSRASHSVGDVTSGTGFRSRAVSSGSCVAPARCPSRRPQQQVTGREERT